MSTSCLKGHRAGHPDAVDSSFDTLFLAGLRQFIQQFEGIFPDRRLHRVFGQLLKGVIAAGVPILSRIAAAVIGSTDPRRGFHVAKRSTAGWRTIAFPIGTCSNRPTDRQGGSFPRSKASTS